MVTKILHSIVIHNYVKSGIRYGTDLESSWYTGDRQKYYYQKTYRFWSKLYHKLGYRLIEEDVWLGCTYDRHTYKRYLKIKRF